MSARLLLIWPSPSSTNIGLETPQKLWKGRPARGDKSCMICPAAVFIRFSSHATSSEASFKAPPMIAFQYLPCAERYTLARLGKLFDMITIYGFDLPINFLQSVDKAGS